MNRDLWTRLKTAKRWQGKPSASRAIAVDNVHPASISKFSQNAVKGFVSPFSIYKSLFVLLQLITLIQLGSLLVHNY